MLTCKKAKKTIIHQLDRKDQAQKFREERLPKSQHIKNKCQFEVGTQQRIPFDLVMSPIT